MAIRKKTRKQQETHAIDYKKVRERVISTTELKNSKEYDLTLMGVSNVEGKFEFDRPYPLFGQILTCVEGKGEVFLNGEWMECTPGFAYITPPYKHHAYRSIEACWKLAWVMMRPLFFDHFLQPNEPLLVKTKSHKFQVIIEGFSMEVMERNNLQCRQLWLELLKKLCVETLNLKSTPSRLANLWQVVHENLEMPWDLDKLADLANLSTEHLRRICLEENRITPMKLITKLRMHKAAALLENTSLPNRVICEQVGYASQFAFSVAFKKYFKTSTAQYRLKYQAHHG